jgi:hypothetical protein
MANLLPQPGISANILPARHRTFQGFYSDVELDPCQGRYDSIMNRFDVDMNPGVTHVMLYEQAVGAGIIPQAYLCCAVVGQEVRVFCIHLPSKFMSDLDGTLTPWDGKSFAFLGEVTQAMVTTVSFPNNVFHAVMNIRANSSDHIMTHLDDIGNKGLAPAQANDPDSSIVNTRQIMYLPSLYAALLLDPAGYSLKTTWEILYTAIADANDLINCQTLINWLRAATMSTLAPLPGNGQNTGPSSLVMELTSPVADAKLMQHRIQLLKQTLPALFQPNETLEHAITQMAVAVTQQTNDSRLAREHKAAEADTPKLPSEKFTITLPISKNFWKYPTNATCLTFGINGPTVPKDRSYSFCQSY